MLTQTDPLTFRVLTPENRVAASKIEHGAAVTTLVEDRNSW